MYVLYCMTCPLPLQHTYSELDWYWLLLWDYVFIVSAVLLFYEYFIISGYRYELYCASKALKSTQCTIYTIRNQQEAWEDNLKREKRTEDGENLEEEQDRNICEQYTEEVFGALTRLRYLPAFVS